MLYKAIEHGKEKRKEYRGAKAFVRSCRNHGGCERCENGRQFFDHKKRVAADQELKTFIKGDDHG